MRLVRHYERNAGNPGDPPLSARAPLHLGHVLKRFPLGGRGVTDVVLTPAEAVFPLIDMDQWRSVVVPPTSTFPCLWWFDGLGGGVLVFQ